MTSGKEYEMLFRLGADISSSFNGTFSKAQKELLSMQKGIEALNKTQADISSYQKQQQAVESTKNKLSVLQQQYDNIQKEIKETEGYSSSLENKLLSKQQQIDKTSASLEKETSKLNEMGNSLKEAGIDTNNLSSASQGLSAKIETLKARQTEAAESAENFGETSVNAFELIQQAIVTAGVATAVKEIAEAYKECVVLAGDFEETMSTVEALSGSSARETQELSEFAKELGATTKFTAIESGEAMTYMAMAGWDATQMMSGMDGVLQLAAASGEDLAMVSDIVTDNLTAFGLKASDTAHFSDVLAAAATNSNTSVGIMGETFKNCAALAGALDYSVEDVAVAVGLMANAGIKGSNAGTALKNTFNGLLSGITLTSEAFGEVEYSAINADGTMKSFGETINDLRGYFSQMTGAEQLHNAEAIAGQRAMAGFVSILNSTDDDFNKLTKNINSCTGAASKMAQIKLDNLNGQLTLMSSASDALKTTIGEGFNPELRKLSAMGTEVLTEVNDFAKANPPLIKGVTAFTGVLATATTGLLAYSSAAKIIKALNMASLFSASWPIMATVGAIAGITAGIFGIAEAYNEAQEAARQYGTEATEAAEAYKASMDEANELEKYTSEWRALNETISSGTAPVEEVNAAKERLKENEQWLIDNYGIYMDADNSVSEEEIASLETRNEELRETARLQAEIELIDAKKRYENGKKDIGDTQSRLDRLSEETVLLAKGQSLLAKYSAEWEKTVNSDAFKMEEPAKQMEMFDNKIQSLNKEMQELGLNYDFTGSGFAGIEVTLEQMTNNIGKNQEKIKKYKQELLEYKESAAAYKKATEDVIGIEVSDIPTESLKEFAEVARSIGQEASDAELGAAALNKYAEELTKAAHAAGLLPDNQIISFNADGALNVLEEVTEDVDNLNGKTVEIKADADTKNATVKIGDLQYKVIKYDASSGIATLSADGKKAYGEINIATGEVRKFDEQEAEAFLDANTSNFDSNISNAKNELKALDGKTVTVTTIFKSVYQTVKSALGINEYATGTTSAERGFAMVGENGPELIYFNGGEQVLNAEETAALKEYGAASQQMQVISFLPALADYLKGASFKQNMQNAVPQNAMPLHSPNHVRGSDTPINITNTFNIEGDASPETVSALSDFGDNIRQIIREEFNDISAEKNRMAYI